MALVILRAQILLPLPSAEGPARCGRQRLYRDGAGSVTSGASTTAGTQAHGLSRAQAGGALTRTLPGLAAITVMLVCVACGTRDGARNQIDGGRPSSLARHADLLERHGIRLWSQSAEMCQRLSSAHQQLLTRPLGELARTPDTVASALLASDVAIVADVHDREESRRGLVWVLRLFQRAQPKHARLLGLALEALPLDSRWSGNGWPTEPWQEAEVMTAMRRTWGWSLSGYPELLAHARALPSTIIGLGRTMAHRLGDTRDSIDRWRASVLASWLSGGSGVRRLCVLIGSWHALVSDELLTGLGAVRVVVIVPFEPAWAATLLRRAPEEAREWWWEVLPNVYRMPVWERELDPTQPEHNLLRNGMEPDEPSPELQDALREGVINARPSLLDELKLEGVPVGWEGHAVRALRDAGASAARSLVIGLRNARRDDVEVVDALVRALGHGDVATAKAAGVVLRDLAPLGAGASVLLRELKGGRGNSDDRLQVALALGASLMEADTVVPELISYLKVRDNGQYAGLVLRNLMAYGRLASRAEADVAEFAERTSSAELRNLCEATRRGLQGSSPMASEACR